LREAGLAHLELVNVSKHYGPIAAISDLSLAVARGERLALLGPSGCGKTTTMNLIAGFMEPDRGGIWIGGNGMAGIPAHKRSTAMVFQSYALFPHMTVKENLAFGLKIRKLPRADIDRRVGAALEMVRLSTFADRYPRQLSGGQQQRVALARALVIEPDILLLDEPLSNLDAKLRQAMRVELLDILGAVQTTTILVTHDQEEALTLADRVAIINAGRLEQVGAPGELYENPATGFVAKFLGERNVLTATIIAKDGPQTTCALEGGLRIRSDRPICRSAPSGVARKG
jgi:ABC-type Fe3+/spermidine/putrescine transport system ATPase subunit